MTESHIFWGLSTCSSTEDYTNVYDFIFSVIFFRETKNLKVGMHLGDHKVFILWLVKLHRKDIKSQAVGLLFGAFQLLSTKLLALNMSLKLSQV